MIEIPEFAAPLFLNGGHRQTLFAFLVSGAGHPYQATPHVVEVSHGDAIVLHDDCPADWSAGAPVALLMHGLSGCHQSAYMVRIAKKLVDRGVRVFRMDHRGCGATEGQCRYPYHAGIVEDAVAAWTKIREICPDSPGAAVGFSLSGNIVLRACGTVWNQPGQDGPDCCVAANAPIDLDACSVALMRRDNRIYESHFVKLLTKQVLQRVEKFEDAPRPHWNTPPNSLRDFDDFYTSRVSGYRDASDYYERASSCRVIPDITVPTLLLTSRDDPLIPVESYERLDLPACVTRYIASAGGHLGYMARKSADADRRWMDWRVVDWLMAHFAQSKIAPPKMNLMSRIHEPAH